MFWPSAALVEFQTSVALAFSRVVRCLVHGCKLMPWLSGPLFDIRQTFGRRQALAIELWEKPPCCIDVYLCRQLRRKPCVAPADILEDGLVQFMPSTFTRRVATSTCVDGGFRTLVGIHETIVRQ